MKFKETHIEVLRALLALMETCLEGIKYIHYRLNETIISSTIYLLEDVIQAFFGINRILSMLVEYVGESNHLLDYLYNIEFILSDLVADFEDGQVDSALIQLDKYLIPQFTELYQETNKYYFPFIVS